MQSGLSLRVATEDDAKAFLSIYAPYVESTAITFEYDVPSEEEFRGRIRRTIQHYPYLAAIENGEVVGYAYAGRFGEREAYDWAAELSVYVSRDMRGHGVGKALYNAMEDILRKQNIVSAYACIACPEHEDEYLTRNSIGFHQHMGYRVVGEFPRCGYKFNRWYGMVWMEKQLGEHIENQPSVRAFAEVRDSLDLK